MKLSLIFLTLCYCMVASSYGQNFFYWPFSSRSHPLWAGSNNAAQRLVPYAPRHQYYNNFRPESSLYQEEDEAYFVDDDDVFARNKFLSDTSSKIRQKFGNQLMAKQLIGARNTRTVFVVSYASTTTVTPTSVVKCLERTQFAAEGAAPAAASTKACSRRKREILSIHELNPSSVSQIETTAVNAEIDDRTTREIQTSYDHLQDYQQDEWTIPSGVSPRFGFSLLNSILFSAPVTTTTTILPKTVVIADAKTMTSTAKLILTPGAAPANNAALLQCLPDGYVVCV